MRSGSCRVAFVGSGGMIREHIRAFRDVAGVEVVGITSRTLAKAQAVAAEFNIPLTCASVAELYAETRADLVVMAVYEPAIRAVAEACFAHDWAVMMEKPIGLDLDEAHAVAALADTARRNVWVGLNRRALSSTVAALRALDGDSGPRFIHVQDQQSLETARAIGHIASVVDNWMFANSIHLVDYLAAFGRGRIRDVQRINAFDPSNPGVVLARIDFESGDLGLYDAIWNGPGPWACTVSTPKQRWEMRPLERAMVQAAGQRTLEAIEPDPRDQAFKPGFRLQAERVVAAWRGEKSAAPTIADALSSTELTARLYQPGTADR